ncbi:MAG: hypothetical protein K0S41_4046 [Anaerocolumna sp.]|jgi:hypothetical protein|nr:hypothetical protein [Anaerocolumna sp.]
MKRIKKLIYSFIISLSLVTISPVSIAGYHNGTVIEVQAKSQTVYVTPTGKKYHKKKCGNGTYTKSTLDKAKKAGLTPCKKCYGK